MPKFAANLSMMFNEASFLDRFELAATSGFESVEFLFPYAHTARSIAQRLNAYGLTQALFNFPPGDWESGDRGLAALPDRFSEFTESVDIALEYATILKVQRLHVMSGIAPRSPQFIDAYKKSIAYASNKLAKAGIDLVLEPINPRNMPGYFLNDFGFAEDVVEELRFSNLKLQFDIYHRQIMHGDVTMALGRLMPMIGHVQVASVPSRHEPCGEELNFPFLFDELDRLGYRGFVGCEYLPRTTTIDGLGWFSKYVRKNLSGAKR